MKKRLLLSIVNILICAFCEKSLAQIVYHDIVPDTTIDTWNYYSPSFGIANANLSIWYHPVPQVDITANGNCQLLFEPAGIYPAKLNLNDSISGNSQGLWQTASGVILNDGTNG